MMKKLLFVLAAFVSVNVFAGIDGGLEADMTKVGVYGGVSMPVSDWEEDMAPLPNVTYKPGNTGFIGGAEIIRYVSPALGFGLDISYAGYGNEEIDYLGANVGKIKSNVMGAHFMGRINFMGEQAARLYIPLGVGISRFEAEMDVYGVGTTTANQTGISLLGGLGFEFDLSPVWTMGVEGRYFYMPLDNDKFLGSDKFDSFHLMVKLGARF